MKTKSLILGLCILSSAQMHGASFSLRERIIEILLKLDLITIVDKDSDAAEMPSGKIGAVAAITGVAVGIFLTDAQSILFNALSKEV